MSTDRTTRQCANTNAVRVFPPRLTETIRLTPEERAYEHAYRVLIEPELLALDKATGGTTAMPERNDAVVASGSRARPQTTTPSGPRSTTSRAGTEEPEAETRGDDLVAVSPDPSPASVPVQKKGKEKEGGRKRQLSNDGDGDNDGAAREKQRRKQLEEAVREPDLEKQRVRYQSQVKTLEHKVKLLNAKDGALGFMLMSHPLIQGENGKKQVPYYRRAFSDDLMADDKHINFDRFKFPSNAIPFTLPDGAEKVYSYRAICDTITSLFDLIVEEEQTAATKLNVLAVERLKKEMEADRATFRQFIEQVEADRATFRRFREQVERERQEQEEREVRRLEHLRTHLMWRTGLSRDQIEATVQVATSTAI